MQEYPAPTPGASLIIAFRPKQTLIVGSGPLAATRAFAALEAGSNVTVIAKGGAAEACEELKWRFSHGELDIVDWNLVQSEAAASSDAAVLEHFLDQTSNISLACITDTTIGSSLRTLEQSQELYRAFQARNIPVNTTDVPDLCDFTFTSTHRFTITSDNSPSPLQIGVTTNGQGCRLASRLRRDIVAKLPADVGSATTNIGQLRSQAKASAASAAAVEEQEEIEEDSRISTPNRPVPSRTPSSLETDIQKAKRRMKWVAQVSEYWPLSKLASLSQTEMAELLDGDVPELPLPLSQPLLHDTLKEDRRGKGRIFLVGSGPGHPSLLTLATHTVLTKVADIVLSDKLVPDAVLAVIPKHVEVRIARKFPGNAEAAQSEMMDAAVEAAGRGLNVVRLKQGDPVVYGRAGEEVLFFRSQGYESLLIPGVSSVLAGPTFAGIPVTQRGVAESFIVCTGVGRNGKETVLPGYERGRTMVVLMGVARLAQVVQALADIPSSSASSSAPGTSSEGTEPPTKKRSGRREGPVYPLHTPIAIIERASMPDQRVITSTLRDIVQALDSSGEQRPPGMMVIGWSVLALDGAGDVSVLEEGGEEKDEERVKRWLDGTPGWRVKIGIDEKWNLFQA